MMVPQNESEIPPLEPPQVHLAHYRPDVPGQREIRPRLNYNWQLLYVLTPHEFRCSRGIINELEACLYVIPPGFAYAVRMRSYRHYSCHFSSASYWSHAEVVMAHRLVSGTGWKKGALKEPITTLRLEGTHWNLCYRLRRNGVVTQHFEDLIDSYRKEDRFGARARLYRLLHTLAQNQTADQSSANIRAFVDYLNHRIHEACSVEDLAKECHLSRSQLNRYCKQLYGVPAKELIMRGKLALAEVLLSRNTPVQDVARACGFEDPYYFSRWFRQRQGYPPSQVPQEVSRND